jgi:hypothetical protein
VNTRGAWRSNSGTAAAYNRSYNQPYNRSYNQPYNRSYTGYTGRNYRNYATPGYMASGPSRGQFTNWLAGR